MARQPRSRLASFDALQHGGGGVGEWTADGSRGAFGSR